MSAVVLPDLLITKNSLTEENEPKNTVAKMCLIFRYYIMSIHGNGGAAWVEFVNAWNTHLKHAQFRYFVL